MTRKEGVVSSMLRRKYLLAALIATLLAGVYWGFIASDRFVSEAHVIVQKTDMASGQTTDLSSLLGTAGSTNVADQLLLRDHLLSTDMLDILDEKLNLRAHFSDPQRDFLSRLWDENTEKEWFYKYYLSRVSVDFDSYTGILIIKAEGFDSKTAHDIASLLVSEGEQFMNNMAHRLAQEQVTFLEQQLVTINERVASTRRAVLEFQNEHGLVSPEGTAEGLAGIINGLESKLAELQARRSAMLGYLMESSADVVELNLQIAAVEKQIKAINKRLATPSGQALNETVEEYQRLQMDAAFAQDIYKTALVALQQGHIDATRTLKKLSVLQMPTVPQYPLEPRRVYNIIVFFLVSMLVAGIAHLIAAIIRDHKD